MYWLLAILGLAVVLLVLLKDRKPTTPSTKVAVHDAQRRAASLPPEQQQALALEARKSANDNYDRNFKIAVDHGKSDSFAHQVGVFSAMKAVLAPESPLPPADEQALQLETMPFNPANSEGRRDAVSEYLVWKFFPKLADEAKFATVLEDFRKQIILDAAGEPDADAFIFEMLYSNRFDWQAWLANHPVKEQ